MELPAGTHLGPYELIGPLGAGGMGEVYRVLGPQLSREVATALSSGFEIRSFDVSPDGHRILFDRYRKTADIVLIDLPSP